MRQASWNMCPQAIQYNTDCYADPDNTFNSIAGSSSSPMPDLPDGDWALVLKKDIFQKVQAAAYGAGGGGGGGWLVWVACWDRWISSSAMPDLSNGD